jgi:hypothetical protein
MRVKPIYHSPSTELLTADMPLQIWIYGQQTETEFLGNFISQPFIPADSDNVWRNFHDKYSYSNGIHNLLQRVIIIDKGAIMQMPELVIDPRQYSGLNIIYIQGRAEYPENKFVLFENFSETGADEKEFEFNISLFHSMYELKEACENSKALQAFGARILEVFHWHIHM